MTANERSCSSLIFSLESFDDREVVEEDFGGIDELKVAQCHNLTHTHREVVPSVVQEAMSRQFDQSAVKRLIGFQKAIIVSYVRSKKHVLADISKFREVGRRAVNGQAFGGESLEDATQAIHLVNFLRVQNPDMGPFVSDDVDETLACKDLNSFAHRSPTDAELRSNVAFDQWLAEFELTV